MFSVVLKKLLINSPILIGGGGGGVKINLVGFTFLARA